MRHTYEAVLGSRFTRPASSDFFGLYAASTDTRAYPDTDHHANRYANRRTYSDIGPDTSAYQNTQTNPYGKVNPKPVHAHLAANGHSFAHATTRSGGQSN